MNKITRCGISLLIVISLLCACQATTAPSVSESALAASPVSSAESQVQAENAPITTEQLLEDYDFLWTALEENYVFFPILERQGIDVSSIRPTLGRRFKIRSRMLRCFMRRCAKCS